MGGTLGSDGCPVRSVGPAGPAPVPVGGGGPGTDRSDGTARRRAPHRTGPRRYRPAVGDGYRAASPARSGPVPDPTSRRAGRAVQRRRTRGAAHQPTSARAVTSETATPTRKARGS